MADPVKISKLPPVTSINPADTFVINDVTSGGTEAITSVLSLGTFVGWLTEQDLQFSGNIELGGIVPGPSGLNITVNGVYVKDSIEIDSFANVSGFDINDLDDVSIDQRLLKQGQVLMWDSSESSWKHDYINLSNAGDDQALEIENLRDSIDTLKDSIDTLQDRIDDLESTPDGIQPPPNDNNLYVMQNGGWVLLPDVIVPETFNISRDIT